MVISPSKPATVITANAVSETTDTLVAAKIVIVEDDREISRLTVLLLESEGFACHPIYKGDEAATEIASVNPDLVILDIMLPGKNGVEICSEIRSFYPGPVLMLTGCDDDFTELASFKKGADDYVIKPIKPHLLVARIRALLKRAGCSASTSNASLSVGEISINCNRREVFVGGQSVSLTASEFDILLLLAQQAGTIISREECCQKLRGFDYDGIDRSIDMRISSLRKKITPLLREQQGILTVRNRGYMLTKE